MSGKKFAKVRADLHLTQDELALELDVAPSSIRRIEGLLVAGVRLKSVRLLASKAKLTFDDMKARIAPDDLELLIASANTTELAGVDRKLASHLDEMSPEFVRDIANSMSPQGFMKWLKIFNEMMDAKRDDAISGRGGRLAASDDELTPPDEGPKSD